MFLYQKLLFGVLFFFSALANAFEPFVVRDIRVEGLEWVEPATVFGYLPIRRGELLTEKKADEALKALFGSGLFHDVHFDTQGEFLVVSVKERPVIASLDIVGNREFESKALKSVLGLHGVAEARVFDRAVLTRSIQELKNQYIGKGKYGIKVTETITPLARNRVGLSLLIEEGGTAKISSIRFIGNHVFSESTLLNEMKMSTPGWLTWYSKTDRYTREKLDADLVSLKAFYTDRGYFDFLVESTQVALSPDREGIALTIVLSEGLQYKVSGAALSGNLLGRRSIFEKFVSIKVGEVFSSKKVNEVEQKLTKALGELGYAFAKVKAIPRVDREKQEVALDFFVDPARRVYVRRINISGNAVTRDEVIRRELLQYESAWYDAEKIRMSRDRLNRLGFFSRAEIYTQPVAEAVDQVDLNVFVDELKTSNFRIGLGFSSTETISLFMSFSKQNFLGTGRTFSLSANTGRLFRTFAISYTNPYYTIDGISQSLDLYYRTFNAAQLDLGDYRVVSSGLGVRFGIPYTEYDRLSAGLSFERTQLYLGPDGPPKYVRFVEDFGESSYAVLGRMGWSRDSRDSYLSPTVGRFQNAALDLTLPVGNTRYWRATYDHQWYIPLSRRFTLALNLEAGLGGGFGGRPFPVFKNFYAGGIGSVRGFYPSWLGPREEQKDRNGQMVELPEGGQARVGGSVEIVFPFPGMGSDRSLRSFVFLDAGNVFSTVGDIDFSELRYSAGIGLTWESPLGPLKLSLGYPLWKRPEDRVQQFQFQIGSSF